jgi:hypothetical protein
MKELDIKEDETIQNQKHQVPFRGMWRGYFNLFW